MATEADKSEVGRRTILGVASMVAANTLLPGGRAEAAPGVGAEPPATPPANALPLATMDMVLRVNGRTHALALDPRTTVLETLRDHLALTGAKKGCDHGQCGACTIHVDGRRVLACLTLAAGVQGRAITTIEGLAAPDGSLHPMQQAFLDQDGFQCGYCTPGQIMSAVACVNEGHADNRADIREYMSGNLCRCAAYPNIVEAIAQARPQMAEG